MRVIPTVLPARRLTSPVADPANGGMAEDARWRRSSGRGTKAASAAAQRGTTLAELSGATGISVSTLSRLESGQRKPTLELLLPLARAHRVPLDELVGAPETGDPRVHPRPSRRTA